MYLGQLLEFAGDFEIKGTMFCDGRLLQVSEQPDLFQVIGNKYGGDGVNTFALPDYRSRVSVGAGQGSGLSNGQVGDKGGKEQVQLSVSEIPSHNHLINAKAAQGTTNSPTNTIPANTGAFDNEYASGGSDTQMSDTVISETGGDQPHENRQPYLVCTRLIVVCGEYPCKKSC